MELLNKMAERNKSYLRPLKYARTHIFKITYAYKCVHTHTHTHTQIHTHKHTHFNYEILAALSLACIPEAFSTTSLM